MSTESELEMLTKLRLHLRSNPELGAKLSEAIGNVAKEAGIELDADTFENLVVIHKSEMDTKIAVTVLPVGSQCGLV